MNCHHFVPVCSGFVYLKFILRRILFLQCEQTGKRLNPRKRPSKGTGKNWEKPEEGNPV